MVLSRYGHTPLPVMSSGLRTMLSFTAIVFFLLYVFFSGVKQRSGTFLGIFKDDIPDFGNYKPLRTLSPQEFPIDDPSGRVIVIGDIHGMYEPFQTLLNKLSFDSKSDTLVHVGDIISKGKHEDSLAVLSYLSTHNVTGVRGNHDQTVIEWRAWMNWIESLPEGALWLRELDATADARGRVNEKEESKGPNKKWWKKIPKGWKLFSEHYKLARAMTDSDYEYLLSLPLTLHVPSAHTYIAHAGLLSSNPRYKPEHRRQPLARIPDLPSTPRRKWDKTKELLRLTQEKALLSDIPQNNDPWVVLNMRGVLKDNSITRNGKKGTAWSKLWNANMNRCIGFDDQRLLTASSSKKNSPLPCHPSSVIYGHAAARRLDIKRWTVGIDTGCVYGRSLTALVLSLNPQLSSEMNDDVDDDAQTLNDTSKSSSSILFGDDGRGRIVSVKCH